MVVLHDSRTRLSRHVFPLSFFRFCSCLIRIDDIFYLDSRSEEANQAISPLVSVLFISRIIVLIRSTALPYISAADLLCKEEMRWRVDIGRNLNVTRRKLPFVIFKCLTNTAPRGRKHNTRGSLAHKNHSFLSFLHIYYTIIFIRSQILVPCGCCSIGIAFSRCTCIYIY